MHRSPTSVITNRTPTLAGRASVCRARRSGKLRSPRMCSRRSPTSRGTGTRPPKSFYDGVGSRLFEEFCGTEDYYITRSETALLRKVAPELAADIPAGAVLVELGSGDSTKTRLLLDAAPQLSAYVPIDISADALGDASALLTRDYPALNIVPVDADFTRHFSLPPAAVAHPRVGFLPGSTICNFYRDAAVPFLRSLRQMMEDDAVFLLGDDLVKNPTLLPPPDDDSRPRPPP